MRQDETLRALVAAACTLGVPGVLAANFGKPQTIRFDIVHLVSPVAAAAVLVLGLIVAPPALARVSVAPKLARTVVVSRVSGRVSVEVRGTHAFSNLTGPRSIPVGSTVDAMDGNVRLVTASTTSGTTQYGLFDGGAFVVTQDRSGLATLRLVAGRQATAVCRGPRGARAAALPASVLRLLHGNHCRADVLVDRPSWLVCPEALGGEGVHQQGVAGVGSIPSPRRGCSSQRKPRRLGGFPCRIRAPQPARS